MPLSAEDSLRLNVMLATEPLAIRVNESSMSVHALSDDGDAKVTLSPNCRDEKYIKLVRELLSGHVMGSPGGYPVFLKRWTRMGQARDDNLAQLLLLGEPEAVVAVVCAEGLTNELARRAWWTRQEAEHARRMLERDQIVAGAMGPILAEYLIEFLPFEESPIAMARSVKLVLQPGLISDKDREKLWKSGQRKNAYLLGFLNSDSAPLLDLGGPHPKLETTRNKLVSLAEMENPVAASLLALFSPQGQKQIDIAAMVLEKPLNQDVVNELFDSLAALAKPFKPVRDMDLIIDEVLQLADAISTGEAPDITPEGLIEVRDALPELSREIRAMIILASLGYPVVRPVFSHSTAIGSLMRRKIEPVTNPVFEQFSILTGKI
ncbi:MAG TPA: sulfur reduction protein DsrS [Chromatiaceae bacterium]|jgi:hypothetical protein|nr:sulfur reduction protein DsrS [Chromatiaceae bacterium]